MNTSTEAPVMTVWPCLQARHARSLIDWLVTTFGFEETAVYTEGDTVIHAQLDWPQGGGIMLGDNEPTDDYARPAGAASCYIVTVNVDALYERAKTGGARIVRELRDEDYGNRAFVAADPEGNLWSFGTYRGEPRRS
ncbi:VOC family protein [Hoyosella sp. YIM 151337]|uniref:VOC family protein n=1 Tax=Hoyosella sp. YIM 151337 TaxID=2992742 RepID=UPI002236A3C6|nr:VOC family protein [Hoyosella sp. YIM 151337]MCW4354317.1 VOC family protein [Hoyosella sp. YIM 151337]